jgi:diacylglycerol kinase family enzyme
MRTRERIERWVGYRLASAAALIWTFARMRTMAVELEVEGVKKRLKTPLLFVAVGERELKVPTLGGRVPNGKRGLHVMAVRGRRRARLFIVALDAFFGGVRKASRSPELDTWIVDRLTITLRRSRVRISFDGEPDVVHGPLEYRIERDALIVAVPDPALAERDTEAAR